MRVNEKMTTRVVSVSSAATLAEVKSKMDEGGFRRVPVIDKGKLVGIVSERDLRQHIGALAHTKVTGVMSSNVVTASPTLAIENAARLMLQHKIGGIPVVEEDGKLVGIITATDLLAAFVDLIARTGSSS